MNHHRISFATIFDLGQGLYSIVVDEAYEIDLCHVDELHSYMDFLTKGKEFVILVHRLYSYSYSTAAKAVIADMKNLCAIAMVVYDEISLELAEMMKSVNDKLELSFDIFSDEKNAESWLRQELDKSSALT